MAEVGIDVTVIPTSDRHDSEYVNPYFRCREYFSGFTGSAGTLVVTKDRAALFTDGRYYLQAERELQGSGITLMKSGEPGVPTVEAYVDEMLPDGGTVGFDGTLFGARWAMGLRDRIKDRRCRIDYGFDPAEGIWKDRPEMESHPLFHIPVTVSGETAERKLTRIFAEMEKQGCDSMIVTTLDDIAWILNLRGGDIDHCPLFYANLLILGKEVHLYTDAEVEPVREKVPDDPGLASLILHPYRDFYGEGLESVNLRTKKRLYSDMSRISCGVYMKLRDGLDILDRPVPSTRMKAVKNECEIRALKRSHIKDGIAMLRFGKWLKELGGNYEGITELTVARKVLEFRSGQEGFLYPSFETISAYGEHGAVIHYSPDEETDIPIREGSFLLVDSGGHYTDGSTDITRTYPIGKVPDKLKEDYTLVLRAMLKLMNLKFLKGASGANLDMAVRELFWEKGLDFKHGTGHGVGFLLNIHEGPNSIRWRVSKDKIADDIFEPGMVTSDEPGLYIAGQYGIRIENEILCCTWQENEYGTFYAFEPLTFVPVDLEAVDLSSMKEEDIRNLNAYHAHVYETLSPYLTGEELDYLKEATRAVPL